MTCKKDKDHCNNCDKGTTAEERMFDYSGIEKRLVDHICFSCDFNGECSTEDQVNCMLKDDSHFIPRDGLRLDTGTEIKDGVKRIFLMASGRYMGKIWATKKIMMAKSAREELHRYLVEQENADGLAKLQSELRDAKNDWTEKATGRITGRLNRADEPILLTDEVDLNEFKKQYYGDFKSELGPVQKKVLKGPDMPDCDECDYSRLTKCHFVMYGGPHEGLKCNSGPYKIGGS